MKTLILIAVASLFTAHAFAAADAQQVKDQSWSCSRQDTESAALLAKYWKRHPGSRKGTSQTAPMGMDDNSKFTVVIKDGKLADLNLEDGFFMQNWKLADAANDDTYSFVQPSVSKKGKISFDVSMNGYDHAGYTITLDPKKSPVTALLTSGGEMDCGDGPHEFLATYICSVTNN